MKRPAQTSHCSANRQGRRLGNEISVYLEDGLYTANTVNQYSSRTVPGAFDVIGVAFSTNGVTVNSTAAQYRRGEYFRHEFPLNNAGTNPAVTGVSVVSGATTISGKMILSPTNQVFLYDADGNLTNDYVWKYTWDEENRLIQMVNVDSPGMNATNRLKLAFEYDWRGRRIRKTVTRLDTSAMVLDNKFLYDGWNLIAELNGTNNNVIRSYVWGLDLSGSLQGAGGVGGLLIVKDATQGTHFAAYDLNGNVAGLVSASGGASTARYEYGPFGEVIRATGPMAKANPFRFSNKYQDDETDLLYYGYRYYNASTGRWLSRDPLGELTFFSNAISGLSREQKRRLKAESLLPEYTVLGNDSVNKVDALGQSSADLMLKMFGKQIPKAIGGNAGAFVAAKIPGLKGFVAGANTTVMFFPDTCEVAAYSVKAWTGDHKEWQGGVMASIGVALELAVYTGDSTPGHASAASYAGPFYTAQIGTPAIGVADFFSLANESGGIWSGLNVSGGAGGGAAINEWDYELLATVVLPKCLCYAKILAMP